MRIAFLSDLHLSPQDPSCRFTWPEGEFVSFCATLTREFDRVVVVGDLFDTTVTSGWGGRRARLKRARDSWPHLVETLCAPNVSWVFGNHDSVLADESIPEAIQFETPGLVIHILHGHQFETRPWWLDRTKNSVKRLAAGLQRTGLGVVGDAMYMANRWVAHPSSKELSSMDRRALGWVQRVQKRRVVDRSKAHLCVYGHTHRPLLVRDDATGCVLLNTGACSFGRWDWAWVDTDACEVVLCHERPASRRVLRYG